MKTMWIALFTAGALLAQTPAEADRKKLVELKKMQAAKADAAGQAIVLTEDEIGGPGGAFTARRISISGQTMEFVSGMNVGATLKGAPYSAEAVTETTQTLYDGNRITQKSSTKQYRDSQGRERREEGSPMNVVFISDPVAKASFTLHPDTMTAESSLAQKTFFFAQTAGQAVFTAAVPAVMGTAGPGMVTGYPHSAGGTPKEEDLGTRLFDGVQAQGTRITSTIAAGDIGNERPIEIVDERWYSPELQMTVMTRHADPRSGETTYKLTNIQRLEQVQSLFEVPRSYTIQDTMQFRKKAAEAEMKKLELRKEE